MVGIQRSGAGLLRKECFHSPLLLVASDCTHCDRSHLGGWCPFLGARAMVARRGSSADVLCQPCHLHQCGLSAGRGRQVGLRSAGGHSLWQAGMGCVSTWRKGKTEAIYRFQGVVTKAVKERLTVSATKGNGGTESIEINVCDGSNAGWIDLAAGRESPAECALSRATVAALARGIFACGAPGLKQLDVA